MLHSNFVSVFQGMAGRRAGLLLLLLRGLGALLACGATLAAAHFTNEWAVRVEGGPRVASLIADQMGYSFKGPVSRGMGNVTRSGQ